MKALVVLVHGGAEHSGRYAHLAGSLVHHGYGLAAYDQRGHGRSEGKRFFVRAFETYVDDLAQFSQHIQEQHPHLPLFLMGHSMGGTVATLFALTRPSPFAGLLLSGPLLRPGSAYTGLQTMIAKLLGRLLPHLPIQRIKPTDLSRDPEIVSGYETDPLVHHGPLLAGMGAAGLLAFEQIDREVEKLSMPLLLLHGTADQIAAVNGSKWFHQQTMSQDKTLHLYDGFFHEVLNEIGRGRVVQDILTWLEERMS